MRFPPGKIRGIRGRYGAVAPQLVVLMRERLTGGAPPRPAPPRPLRRTSPRTWRWRPSRSSRRAAGRTRPLTSSTRSRAWRRPPPPPRRGPPRRPRTTSRPRTTRPRTSRRRSSRCCGSGSTRSTLPRRREMGPRSPPRGSLPRPLRHTVSLPPPWRRAGLRRLPFFPMQARKQISDKFKEDNSIQLRDFLLRARFCEIARSLGSRCDTCITAAAAPAPAGPGAFSKRSARG